MLDSMSPLEIAAYVLWMAAGAFLMRFELRTDDTGVLVFFVLLTNFLLGSLHPRRAWQWALLVAACVPSADLIFGRPGHPMALDDAAKIFGFLTVVGLIGAYAGVLLRKALAAAMPAERR